MQNIRQNVLNIVEGLSLSAPINDEDLLEGLGIDSLKLVELILALEDAFGIQFSASKLDAVIFNNVSDIISLVEETIALKGSRL